MEWDQSLRGAGVKRPAGFWSRKDDWCIPGRGSGRSHRLLHQVSFRVERMIDKGKGHIMHDLLGLTGYYECG